MTDQQTLGEQKTTDCAWCQTAFVKKRYDQKFCSKLCGQKLHNSLAVWSERPNRENLNQNRMSRYYANQEKELEKHRTWRREHLDEARAKDREEYRRNKDKHTARVKRYRAENPLLWKKCRENARQKSPWKDCLSNARNRSLKKGFAFDLTREWCAEKYTGQCDITKLPFYFGTQNHYPFSPSIDRIDSTKGYTQDNCRFVLFAVNSLKGIGTDEQMLQIAQAIVSSIGCPSYVV